MNKRDEASLRNIDYSLTNVCNRHWHTKTSCDSCPFYIEAFACCIKKQIKVLIYCSWEEDERKERMKNA